MLIRPATLADAAALVPLSQSVQEMHAAALPERFRQNVPNETMERAIAAMIQATSAYWLVAEEDRPIAFLSAEFRDREESWCLVAHRVCYLAGLAVAPPLSSPRHRPVAPA